MPSIIEQLREIQAAMPVGAEISLSITHGHPKPYLLKELPAGFSEVRVEIKAGVQTFYVQDWEWEKGEIAGELIGHMRAIMEVKGLA